MIHTWGLRYNNVQAHVWYSAFIAYMGNVIMHYTLVVCITERNYSSPSIIRAIRSISVMCYCGLHFCDVFLVLL